MDFDAAFPFKFLLNLTRRSDRRVRSEELFARQGWKVSRQPAVDGQLLKSAGGFHSPGQRAHALSTRMILRTAALAKAEAVFIFEDDVVFHPALRSRLSEIELPDDWGIFYLGCQHHERPEVVSRGLVRVTAPLDTHAWAVRADWFREVRRALAGRFWPSGGATPASDLLLAELARRIPAYAAYPNLAWQQEDQSDIAGNVYANYDPDGSQRHARGCLSGVLAESLGGRAHPPAVDRARQNRAWFWPPEIPCSRVPSAAAEPVLPPLREGEKVAFLFLTRGPHLLPDLWDEYWRGHESRIAVFGHAKERGWPVRPGLRDWLAEAQITEHLPTQWGDVSLVRAQMALLKAALRHPENRFFVFASESCAPARPLGDLLRLLAIDGRSRFQIEYVEDVAMTNPVKASRAHPAGRITPGEWRFHSPWMLLNREAAELLVANESLLECFAGTHGPDECAFGTILNVTGYPLEWKVAAQDVTWSRWPEPDSAFPDTVTELTSEAIGDIAGSGCYFARKFPAGSRVGEFGLHRSGDSTVRADEPP